MNRLSKKALALLSSAALLAGTVPAALADQTVDTILNAGTTQAFSDQAVSADDIQTILQAGLATASAINQQPWFLVAVTDPDVLEKLGNSGASMTPPAGAALPEGASAPEGAPAAAPEGAPASAPEGIPAAAPSGMGAKASLGDSPAAIIIYRNDNTKSPDPAFDCGLCAQSMYIAAAALGYGVKIVSAPTMTLNGTDHDAICEQLGVDPALQAEAVLLIGYPAEGDDAVSGATTREDFSAKATIIG